MNPAQGRDEVGHTDVHRLLIGRSADLREVEEAKYVEAVVDRDLDHIVAPGHLCAFMRGQFIGRSKAVASAVHVEHHGPAARKGGRPDVQAKHVFALPSVVPILEEGLFRAGPRMQVLGAVCPVDQGGKLILPGRRRLCGKPAVLSGCGLAIGNALKGENAAIQKAAYLAVLRFGDRGAGRGAVAGPLMRGCFDTVGSMPSRASRQGQSGGGGKQ